MRRKFVISFISLALLIFTGDYAHSQFYNGLQMNFGQNRVQYNDFLWQYYRFDRFDTYFYVGGSEIAKDVGKIAADKIHELEIFFDYNLEKRLIFIVYNKLTDFKQSNIGLISSGDQYNIGGVTKIIGNKVFIYNEGDREKLEQQVVGAIAEVLINEMIYGKNFRQRVTNSTLLTLPDWYLKGLISYVSTNWSVEVEDHVRDGILSRRYEKFNRLDGPDAVYAGHSIWNYIANTYGKSVISNIVYLAKISKNIDSGFHYVLGSPLKTLSHEWLDYYDKLFFKQNLSREIPNGIEMEKRPRKTRIYNQVKMSPDGKYAAWSTNEMGQYKVWLYNVEKNKRKKIYRKEHKLDQISDESFPVLSWHPTSKLLAFVIEEKGSLFLKNYLIENKKKQSLEIFHYEKILDFSYADDGMKIAVSAIQKGQTDIFVYSTISNTNTQITNDIADDFDPLFINNSEEILFVSNRKDAIIPENSKEDIETLNTTDIFIYDLKNKSNTLTRISETPYINESKPYPVNKHRFTYLSDENGIVNRFVAKYDSAISFIDTASHYRYFSRSFPITNYSRNILCHDPKPAIMKNAQLVFYDKRPHLLLNDFGTDESLNCSDKMTNTVFRTQLTNSYIMQDSSKSAFDNPYALGLPINIELQEDTLPKVPSDTTVIDIRNYKFEAEKVNSYKPQKHVEEIIEEEQEGENFVDPKQRMYFTAFYTDQVVTQIDFGFLNLSYQAFTGSAVYFNPNFNLFFKIGAKDLFEDYRVTGGFRFAGNFDSNEYLLSFENVKKRVDKQFIFHRQSITNQTGNNILKTQSHEIKYILRYPFSQVLSFVSTLSARNDRIVYQSIDLSSLQEKNAYKNWGGLKLEIIFDNTRSRGVNLYNGTRFKIFAEGFAEIENYWSDLYVIGGDFRHYQKIHRDMIWASRIAGSTSFGRNKLIYYLGSVDNWINLSKKPTFIPLEEVPIPVGERYAYQALATNMRGFSQNIRNGNSFAVMNNEIRWPIIRYFAKNPINSDFLSNLQVVGFFDIGSAWSGKSPMDEKNAYNTSIIDRGSIRVIVDNDRSPFVYGYGVGVRSRLLGYFIRADWAWGVESGIVQPRIFYLSLSLDF